MKLPRHSCSLPENWRTRYNAPMLFNSSTLNALFGELARRPTSSASIGRPGSRKQPHDRHGVQKFGVTSPCMGASMDELYGRIDSFAGLHSAACPTATDYVSHLFAFALTFAFNKRYRLQSLHIHAIGSSCWYSYRCCCCSRYVGYRSLHLCLLLRILCTWHFDIYAPGTLSFPFHLSL